MELTECASERFPALRRDERSVSHKCRANRHRVQTSRKTSLRWRRASLTQHLVGVLQLNELRKRGSAIEQPTKRITRMRHDFAREPVRAGKSRRRIKFKRPTKRVFETFGRAARCRLVQGVS